MTDAQLADVRRALRERITEGLAHEGREIKALPTWMGFPRACRGRAVVVDTGGTNMRAALVELPVGAPPRVLAGPVGGRVPGREQPIDAAAFFDAQAALVAQLPIDEPLPVGYVFSYPAEILPDRDARLIRWTKGLQVRGVEGERVGAGLRAALERQGVPVGEVRVLNDTVASLLAGAATYATPRCGDFVGLIVGTGTNMAAFFRGDRILKLRDAAAEPMAVNLESGNYHPPHLTDLDAMVDGGTDNPGQQRLEKAVSGFYLPLLLAAACPQLDGFDPAVGTRQLVELRDACPDSEAGRASAQILARSADLVAASLAAVIDHYEGCQEVGILAEGSLIWGDPTYAGRVGETLTVLLAGRCVPRLLRMSEANLVGAAAAALME